MVEKGGGRAGVWIRVSEQGEEAKEEEKRERERKRESSPKRKPIEQGTSEKEQSPVEVEEQLEE